MQRAPQAAGPRPRVTAPRHALPVRAVLAVAMTLAIAMLDEGRKYSPPAPDRSLHPQDGRPVPAAPPPRVPA